MKSFLIMSCWFSRNSFDSVLVQQNTVGDIYCQQLRCQKNPFISQPSGGDMEGLFSLLFKSDSKDFKNYCKFCKVAKIFIIFIHNVVFNF